MNVPGKPRILCTPTLINVKCCMCDERPGVHEVKGTYMDMSGTGFLCRTVTYHYCGICLHEETWALSQRLSYVPGQGWTI